MILTDTNTSGTWLSILPVDVLHIINRKIAGDIIIAYYYKRNKEVDTVFMEAKDNLYTTDYFTDIHIALIFKIRGLFRNKMIYNLDKKFWKRKLNVISHILYSSNIFIINGIIFRRYDNYIHTIQNFYSKIIYNIMK